MNDIITNTIEFDEEIYMIASINDTFLLVSTVNEVGSLNLSSHNIINKY